MPFPCELKVTFPSDTPVFGYEINPNVQVNRLGSDPIPDYILEFNWYRLQPSCSVHPSEKATLQCKCCTELKVPVNKSGHCSSKCFLDKWPEHRRRHREAADRLRQTSSGEDQVPGEVRSSGSWPSTGCLSDFEEGLLLDGAATVALGEGSSLLKVGSSETYVPSQGDIGYILRLDSVVRDRKNGAHLAPINMKSTNHVIISPIPRPRRMIPIKPLDSFKRFSSANFSSIARTFSVLTYNVLSNLYAYHSTHSHCPTWALVWEYRRRNLLREIIGYEADILCLQEVQSDHFKNFFEPELAQCGYSAIYKKKNNEMYAGGQSVIDGCATFFRHDRFREIIKYELDFSKIAHSASKALHPSRRDMSHRLMKDNVAVVVILEPLESCAVSHTWDYRFCVVPHSFQPLK